MPVALIFGYGLIGKAFAERLRQEDYRIIATARDASKRAALTVQGMTAIDPSDPEALKAAFAAASAILITPAPTDEGCPAFHALTAIHPPLFTGEVAGEVPPEGALHRGFAPSTPSGFPSASRKWIGYLSTTGVYGDRGGGWVFEDQPANPQSPEAHRRLKAENQWRSLIHHDVAAFRLPGLYGAGRSALDKLKDGTARRIHKPDQVFSRLYDADAAEALWCSLQRPRAGGIYNLCDDEPAAADEVVAYAARSYGFALPPLIAWDDPSLSPAVRRFYSENKRASNALAKAELGWRPRFPTYREGLAHIASHLSLR